MPVGYLEDESWGLNSMSRLKKYLPKTFFLRSLIILVSPVILIHAISGYIFFHRHWDSVQQLLAYNISGEIASLVPLIEENHLEKAQETGQKLYDITVTRESSSPPSNADYPYFQEYLDTHFQKSYTLFRTHKWVTVYIKIKDSLYSFQFLTKRLAPRTTFLFIVWAIGSSILFLMIAAVVMRNQIRPLYRLVAWTKELEAETPKNFPKIEGAKEIRIIAAALHKSVKKIRSSFEERKRMLLGISHDLRTPLARMKLQLSLLPVHEDLKGLYQDVDQMTAMINAYLTFAKQDQEPRSEINLRSLIEQTIPKSSGVEIKMPSHLVMMGQPLQLKRCFQNLIDNALYHGDGQVRMTAHRTASSDIMISIEDNGPGIPESLKEEIFMPFFRADTSRHLEGERVGLGLSIVKSIVLNHGGEIQVKKSSLGGACFQIKFPEK
jgi:two-component system osmolarity sensor histidine kinase EnvZ